MLRFGLVLILSVLTLFATFIPVHAAYTPPFYCMILGSDSECPGTVPSGQPAPSAVVNLSTDPCASNKPQGFFASLFGFFVAFFRSPQDPPCTAAGSPAVQNSVQPVASTVGSSKIQLVDRGVAQVPGQNMFITLNKLQKVQPGDVMIAMIGSDYAHVKTLPAGWKEIRQDVKNSGHKDDLAMQSYYKVVTSTEEASYTWNLVTERDDTPSQHQPLIAVDLYAFRGVDTNDPIFSHDVHGETTDKAAIECPSVPGIAGGVLICAYIGDDPGPVIAPTSMTQTSNFEIAEGDTYAIAYEILSSDGDTGSRVATWTNPDRNKNGSDFAQAVVLRPQR